MTRTEKQSVPEDDRPMGLFEHLGELRVRLIRALLGVVPGFAVAWVYRETLMDLLVQPLAVHWKHLGFGEPALHFANPVDPFMAYMKIAFVVGVLFASPWIFWQLWAFIAPGLYQKEKRLALPVLISSTLLFYCGMAFAYFVIMPIFFAFITSTAPEGVAVMTDINRYLDFVMTIFFAFGVAFEVPVATVILVLTGIITPEAMAAKRPYIIVGAFVVGMLLTPPDVISQTLLAVPMWLLFEIGIFVSRLLLRRRGEARAAAEPSGQR